MRKYFFILTLLATTSCWQEQAVIEFRAPTKHSGKFIVVKSGDSIFSIAKAHNIPYQELLSHNKLSLDSKLIIGQKLILPTDNYYTVKEGDSLSKIAAKIGIPLLTIAKRNNIAYPYNVRIGQKLKLGEMNESIAEEDLSNIDQTTYTSVPEPKFVTKEIATKEIEVKLVDPTPDIPKEQPKLAPKSKLSWPIKGRIISDFGPIAKGQKNDGINIAAREGTEVTAAGNGIVAYAGNDLKGYGNLVIIKHNNDIMTAYAHQSDLLVQKGDQVFVGDVIGHVGSTGGVSQPQLHFAVRVGKKPINPLSYLPPL